MDYFKSLVGGKPAQAPLEDGDFADFATVPDPSPVSIPIAPGDAQAAQPTGGAYSSGAVPYTKWYRVWERSQLSDFYMEGILVPFIILALIVHFWGTSANKKKARKWMAVHKPVLENEFALVGYSQTPKLAPLVSEANILQASGDDLEDDPLMMEKTAWQFESYASGRQNVAFADFKIILKRRMNPFVVVAEEAMGMFFESIKPKPERMEAVIYTFDGNEKNFVPPEVPGSSEVEKAKQVGNSSYDSFVFGVVNKMGMRKLRDERYDVSLTFTKDNPKLPDWATVMSESAEVTETMLTKDLVAAVEKAGDALDYLIISDQPIDKPTKLEETSPKKRIHLSVRLPSNGDYSATLPIFQVFLRLADHLASQAHFRPEVSRKINSVREAEKGKLKKVSDKEAEEERLKQLDKMKKEEKDRKMKNMSAEEQRKYLDREAEKSRKKQEKKMTKRG